MRTLLSLCAALVTVAAISACGERARGGEAETSIAVTDIDVGRSVKADRTIDEGTSAFKPGDIVYVSVGTKGTGSGSLRVRWVFGENEEIATEERQVSGEGHTQFQLSRPGGLNRGEYHVEVTLNGVSQGHENFTVN